MIWSTDGKSCGGVSVVFIVVTFVAFEVFELPYSLLFAFFAIVRYFLCVEQFIYITNYACNKILV